MRRRQAGREGESRFDAAAAAATCCTLRRTGSSMACMASAYAARACSSTSSWPSCASTSRHKA